MSRLLLVLAALALLAALADRYPGILGAVVLAGGALLLLRLRRSRGTVVTGHAHEGSSKLIARHEAGHAAAARGLGGRVVSVTASRSSGLTRAQLPDDDPVKAIAFWFAGRAAAGGAGCGGDDADIRRELRGVPSRDRARVRREGQALGRRLVRRSASRIRRDAATIERTGRL